MLSSATAPPPADQSAGGGAGLRSRLRRCAAADPEGGFTLVEVVFSMVLIGIVMSASLGLFLSSVRAGDVTGQRATAVQLASARLEVVRAKAPSELVAGRTKAMVDGIWAAPGPVSLAAVVESWDATADGTVAPLLDVRHATVVDGVTYTVSTFVDRCYQPPSTTGSCGTATGTGYTPMWRVAVGVTWTPGGAQRCATGTGGCSYAAYTLIDPSTDPTFNVN